MPTTTAIVLQSLASVVTDVAIIKNALADAPNSVDSESARYLKREVYAIQEKAQALIDWLAEARLEAPRQ